MAWIVIRGGPAARMVCVLGLGCGHMANKKIPNRPLSGEHLAKATAEKIFGRKSVGRH
jgi:hypothetical protein